MRTGIQWCPEADIEEKITELPVIKSLGYDCVDFQSFCHTENVFFGEPAEVSRLLKTVRKAAEDAGLTICQTHGPWRWPPQDATKEDRDERFDKMVRSLYGTAELGCSDMVIHPIMPFGDYQNPHPEEFMEMNLEFFTRLTEEAVKAGVVIDFENMPMPALTLATPAQILGFVKAIDSPNFRVCLDTGHCSVTKSDPAEAVRLIGKEYLRVLHVHDNDGRSDFHWLPETGVIDWAEFSKALHDIGYEGVFSLETDVKPAGLTEKEYLEKRKELARTAYRLANG
ncbi:MAG: sugar phosphate isomerase/epimerase [Clostridia bacterium]|nr:sugar phosphate isomerase/epimerase [Clostridia bacterium]